MLFLFLIMCMYMGWGMCADEGGHMWRQGCWLPGSRSSEWCELGGDPLQETSKWMTLTGDSSPQSWEYRSVLFPPWYIIKACASLSAGAHGVQQKCISLEALVCTPWAPGNSMAKPITSRTWDSPAPGVGGSPCSLLSPFLFGSILTTPKMFLKASTSVSSTWV